MFGVVFGLVVAGSVWFCFVLFCFGSGQILHARGKVYVSVAFGVTFEIHLEVKKVLFAR